MKNSKPFNVAMVQHPPVFLNLHESLERACEHINAAAEKGANVVVFPETWLPGYPVWLDFAPRAALWDYPPAKALFRTLVENALNLGSPELKRLQTCAKTAGAYVIVGAHELQGGTLHNTIFYLHKNGRDLVVHRKLMPTYTERMLWGRGDGSTLGTLSTEFGKVGGLICWEHWMPLARAAMHAQQETLHVAQWPMVKEMNLVASRHYAFEGQCFVAAAGCVLSRKDVLEGFRSLDQPANPGISLLEEMADGDDQPFLRGGSAVIAPNGGFLHEPLYDKSEILLARIEPGMITEGKMALDSTGHYSRPGIFELKVNTRAQIDVTFD